jgi:cyclopropane fatty-acyl-phospholipid synthase-like methyltransferase
MVNWWDALYWITPRVSLGRLQSPWDSEQPPKELVEIVEKEHAHLHRVLDVGCGTGNYALYLASKGFQTVGIDISSVAINKARGKAVQRGVECQFHAVDILDFNELSSVIQEPFDLVMDHGCLHSIRKQKRSRYLPSLNYLTHPTSLYVLWAFPPDSSNIQLFNGLGSIHPEEVHKLFANDYTILDERIATHEKMSYLMERK